MHIWWRRITNELNLQIQKRRREPANRSLQSSTDIQGRIATREFLHHLLIHVVAISRLRFILSFSWHWKWEKVLFQPTENIFWNHFHIFKSLRCQNPSHFVRICKYCDLRISYLISWFLAKWGRRIKSFVIFCKVFFSVGSGDRLKFSQFSLQRPSPMTKEQKSSLSRLITIQTIIHWRNNRFMFHMFNSSRPSHCIVEKLIILFLLRSVSSFRSLILSAAL